MQPHEELFFHYLSILAILPSKRQRLTEILGTFGKKDKNIDVNTSNTPSGTLDIVQQQEKRLNKFKTVVEIPEDAILLRANTMMLELYVIM